MRELTSNRIMLDKSFLLHSNNLDKPISVIHLNDRLSIGGVATIILILDKALKEIKTQSIIFVEDTELCLDEKADMQIISFGLSRLRKLLTFISSVAPIKILSKIIEERRKGRKVILHLHTPYLSTAIAAIISSVITKAPLIYSVHANKSHLNRFYWYIENMITYISGKVIFELNASFRDYAGICLEKKIIYIPFGIEKKNATQKWSQTDNMVFTFIAANRLNSNRMTDKFIRAFHAQYNDDKSRLIVIGDGVEYSKLFQLVTELNIGTAVTFLPSVDELTIQEHFIKADCLLTLSASGDVGMTGKIAAGIGMPLLSFEFDSKAEYAYQACTLADLGSKMIWIRSLSSNEVICFSNLVSSKLTSFSDIMINAHVALYQNI